MWTRTHVPYLVTGDSTQALTTNISTADAEMFFADRAHEFNSRLGQSPHGWAANMAGRNDGSTYDGIGPFTGYLPGGKTGIMTIRPRPMKPSLRVLTILSAWRRKTTLLILDPAETIAWLPALLNNGPDSAVPTANTWVAA